MSLFSRFRKPKPAAEVKTDESVKLAEARGRAFMLESELAKVKLEKANLETRLAHKEIIDIKMGDPAPVDSEKRALYVAKVAGLHVEILKPKLKQMISTAHTLLEDSSNDREFDQSVKGGIYMLYEILRWGEMMVNEQIANQTNQNPSLEDELINKKPNVNEN